MQRERERLVAGAAEQAEIDRLPLLNWLKGLQREASQSKRFSVIREEASAEGRERETPVAFRIADLRRFGMVEVLTMREIAASSSATAGPSPPFSSTTNLPLLSAFLAFSVAQFLKIFTTWFKEKRWDSRRLLGSGGMPSSHSATVVALATAIGLQEGTAGSSFALAVVLASVVMYDASGIRLHAGRQAEFVEDEEDDTKSPLAQFDCQLHIIQGSSRLQKLLNQILCELPTEHPLSSIRPLRELLGHTPLQVIAGAILGFIVSFLLRNS